MKALGIVAEYNPFHNGHLYQIKKAKQLKEYDLVVVVMSGNFLQRGEPAIVDKWARAEMALSGGADLIIELPVSFSLQAADYFAGGAVQIMKHLQVSGIYFGAETGTEEEFIRAGKWAVENEERINESFAFEESKNQNYASKFHSAVMALNENFPIDLSKPNNQLGFAYSREVFRQGAGMKIHVLKRTEADYHSTELSKSGSISSATAIRKALFSHKDIEPFVPRRTKQLLKTAPQVRMEDYWPLLQYRYIVSPVEELWKIYQMEDGIEYRLKDSALKAQSYGEFMRLVKPKHLTYNRLQRLSAYVLLGLTKEEMVSSMKSAKALRILGFSDAGREYLRTIKNSCNLPLLSKIDQKNKKLWDLDIRAGEVYRLANKQSIKQQDFRRNPIKILT